MKMLPLCSATTCCSSHSQISIHGGLQHLYSLRKSFEVRCMIEERSVVSLSNGNYLEGVSLKMEDAASFYSKFIDGREPSPSVVCTYVPHQNELGDIRCNWDNSVGRASLPDYEGTEDMKLVANYIASPSVQEPLDFTDQFTQNTDILSEPAVTESITMTYVVPDDTSLPDSSSMDIDSLSSVRANIEDSSLPDSSTMSSDSLSDVKTHLEDSIIGLNESINASVSKGESVLKNSMDTVTSSLTSALEGANKAFDSVVSNVTSSVDRIAESGASKSTSLINNLQEASSKLGIVTVDILRRAIVQVEDSLNQGGSYVIYAYGSAKNMFPPEVQDVLSSSEESIEKILRPAGTAFQQISIALEEVERSLGLDPNDPVIPFALSTGTITLLWISYWFFTYGGYAGNLSAKETLELLKGKKNVVLVDIRPEDLRERDGIPDLRRTSRFRYVNVTLPEVDGSVRKLFKSGKDLDDTLIAAVIRNLKIVQDRSKVVVMDADGTRSKGIARSLRKLRVKQSYLLEGGFRSWVEEGLRIKELKPETALTILNEEAEAILEDVKPTPGKVIAYGLGLIAALYALLEWETTLQLIGIIGLGQTVYRRVASYEDAEDFNQDVRLLLTPVTLGGQAVAWAAGKLESNGVGLPTSPSSSDVQNRVLQAAAKHESQPSDEENQDITSTPSASDSVDLSEA